MRLIKMDVVSGILNPRIGTSISVGATTVNLSIGNLTTPTIEVVGIFPLLINLYIIKHVTMIILKTSIINAHMMNHLTKDVIIFSIITVQPTINMVLTRRATHLVIFILFHLTTRVQ